MLATFNHRRSDKYSPIPNRFPPRTKHDDAVRAADFLGKKRIIKRSWHFSAGKRNVNYNEVEDHKNKPRELRNLRDHKCVLVHCERGFRRVTLPPLESDGTIAKWLSRW